MLAKLLNCDGADKSGAVVYASGIGKDGEPRVQVTQCPGAMLAARPEALEILNWLLSSSPWDGMSGRPSGPPQWPRGRSYHETRASLVGYANIFRSEMGYLGTPSKKLKADGPTPPAKRASRRK